MKSRTAIALTLARILGLAGSVKLAKEGISSQKRYSEIIPIRM